MLLPGVKVPVVLVAGFSQAARHRAIATFLEHERGQSVPTTAARNIAWLAHCDHAPAAFPARLTPDESFFACVCCSGSTVFSAYLVRLLRQRSWNGLFISLGARAQPARVIDFLEQPSWQKTLGPVRLFSMMDEVALALSPDHPLAALAAQQKNLSERILGEGEALPGGLFLPR
jgi:hypothetical protein